MAGRSMETGLVVKALGFVKGGIFPSKQTGQHVLATFGFDRYRENLVR
jgi:hypothetical protein